jgi:hypothetical protein
VLEHAGRARECDILASVWWPDGGVFGDGWKQRGPRVRWNNAFGGGTS